MNQSPTLILASASPRRRELLGQLAVSFKVAPADIDEVIRENESADDFVQRMALEKALAGFKRGGGSTPTLGSDTIVILYG